MITVQADANKVLQPKERAEAVAVLDSNADGLSYLADAMTAISAIIAHAEYQYGPILTDILLQSLENGTMRKAINEGREKANEDQTGDCPGC